MLRDADERKSDYSFFVAVRFLRLSEFFTFIYYLIEVKYNGWGKSVKDGEYARNIVV